MSSLRLRSGAIGVMAALSLLAVPAVSRAGGVGVWTKLAAVDSGMTTAGMLRTADGALHLVWPATAASPTSHSFGWSTLSLTGKLVGSGAALTGWTSPLEPDPQLVPNGQGMRLVFEGNTGAPTNCYARAAVYTETSADGSSWALVPGSLDVHSAGVGNLAATTEKDGVTPVAVFAGGHLFHVGVDPNCPAATPDGTINQTAGSAPGNPSAATDAVTGSVWAAWFQSFVKQGYWVDQILPTQTSPVEAPGSASTATQNNQPLQRVALVARPVLGGVYMAYCTASRTQQCAHIDLWKVGSPRAKVVPGSANSTSTRLTLAAGNEGRLSVVWYDAHKNVIHAIRTNTSVTRFGVLRTIKPPRLSEVLGIGADGTFGRLDILLTILPPTGLTHQLFQTQSLEGLLLTAKPTKFSHKKSKKVAFTVTDAGQPVAGATVSCLGLGKKKAKSSASGRVRLTFPKGSKIGKHACKATKLLYNNGEITIRVT
jgi:hypothetical protein